MAGTTVFVLAALASAAPLTSPDDGAPAATQTPRPASAAPASSPGRSADVKAIEALAAEFTRAFNQGDAQAVAALFTEEAEIAFEDKLATHGRKLIAEQFASVFKANPGDKIELITESLRFPGPDVAREVGRSRTFPAGGGGPDAARYTVLYVRRDGRWLHDSVLELPDNSLSPHDRLKDIEWLVGDWIDESHEGIVRTTCRWSQDKNFLLRDFTLQFRGEPVLSGVQRIGWDPLANQFRSWVFDTEGGFNEGRWARAGKNQWIIRAQGATADGRTVSATQVLTLVNRSMARWQSIDRTVGNEALPDLQEVVLVRTPPRPAAAPPTNTSRQP
jgi:uncharacterized protein (TIGR02246 family)